jgi:ABC-type uncharacterized transport system ATPase subunit
VQDLAAAHAGAAVSCPALAVARGEILGVAGVTGNGQELLGRVLAGVVVPQRGEVLLDGHDVCGRGRREATEAPVVAYVPEQPLHNGCAPGLSLLANLSALHARALAWLPRWTRERAAAGALLDRFDVRPRELERPAETLSGGNLQKLVLARELSRAPTLVVACYPTMGLDLAAAAAVVQELLACAAAGAAVVWISEDLEILLERADRIAVLHAGQLRPPVDAAAATRHELGAWMTGAAS